MQWYHVQIQQDEALRMNGHLRSGSASEAVQVALGRDRRWPVQETGRDAARAIDPDNPKNWCKANGVKGPAWPVARETPDKKKAKKRSTAKKKPAAAVVIEKRVAAVREANKKSATEAAMKKQPAKAATRKKATIEKAAMAVTAGKKVRKSATKSD